MKNKFLSVSIILLVLSLVGCIPQAEIVPTLPFPTQTPEPILTPTLIASPTERASLVITPTIAPRSESFVQLSSLSLPEFNARYFASDLTFSQDGKLVAVASENKSDGDKSVWIWDANDFSQSLAGFQVLVDDLWGISFNTEGTEIALGCSGKILIVDLKTATTLHTIDLPKSGAFQVAFGANNTLVSSSFDEKITVWDLSNHEIKYSVNGKVGSYPNSFAISPDGKVLVTVDITSLHLWDMASGESLDVREGTDLGIGATPATAFSSKGTFLASTGCSEFQFEGCASGKIIIWRYDLTTPSTISKVNASWVTALAFASNEGTLASMSIEGIIHLIDLSDGKITTAPPIVLSGKMPPDNDLRFHDIGFLPHGKTLVVSTSDGIQLLDIASMSWTPNLRFILSLGYSYTITSTGDNLNFRKEPSMNSEIIENLHTGEWFVPIDGPKFADDYVWWKVKIADDTEGWIVEMPGWYEFNP